MNQRQRNAWIEAAKEQVLRNAEASDGCEADLMELYDECVNGLENEIRAFYSRHARDNQLTEAQASKLLTGKEYSTWKNSLEGYLEELEGQGKDSRLALELNTLSAKSQVSRKEQLLANIYHNMARLAGPRRRYCNSCPLWTIRRRNWKSWRRRNRKGWNPLGCTRTWPGLSRPVKPDWRERLSRKRRLRKDEPAAAQCMD